MNAGGEPFVLEVNPNPDSLPTPGGARGGRGGAPLPGPDRRDPAAGTGPGGAVTRVRRIEPGDREAIRELIAGTDAYKPFEVDVAMELVDVAFSRKEQDDYHPYVLAEDDGTVAAYACFGKNAMTTWDLRPAYWIATRTDRTGKGYGRAILSFVEEEVRRRGGYLLVIETSSKESYGSTRHSTTRSAAPSPRSCPTTTRAATTSSST